MRKFRVKGWVRLLLSPAESLNGIPIQEVMVSGNGRNVDGEKGICVQRKRESVPV